MLQINKIIAINNYNNYYTNNNYSTSNIHGVPKIWVMDWNSPISFENDIPLEKHFQIYK